MNEHDYDDQDNICQQEEMLEMRQKCGTTYYRSKKGARAGQAQPQAFMLQQMKIEGNALAISFEINKHTRSYASYKDLDTFLESYTRETNPRRYYEILSGSVLHMQTWNGMASMS